MELKLNITKWTVAKTLIIIGMLFGAYIIGGAVVYQPAFQAGYLKSLTDVKDLLGQKGIAFSWEDMGEGQYVLSVSVGGQLQARGLVSAHLWIEHWRDGTLLAQEYGAGTLTTIGKNFIEWQISGNTTAQRALYCADSNNASAPSAAWTKLPNEITANGLDRQTGAYTSTGDGTWNVSVTKLVTGTQATQLWGLHWIVTDDSDNNLLAADSGPEQKNCENGDTLKETWQVTVT